jgi:hypothetical protein
VHGIRGSGARTEIRFLSLERKLSSCLYYFRQIQFFYVTSVEYIFYFVINKKTAFYITYNETLIYVVF